MFGRLGRMSDATRRLAAILAAAGYWRLMREEDTLTVLKRSDGNSPIGVTDRLEKNLGASMRAETQPA